MVKLWHPNVRKVTEKSAFHHFYRIDETLVALQKELISIAQEERKVRGLTAKEVKELKQISHELREAFIKMEDIFDDAYHMRTQPEGRRLGYLPRSPELRKEWEKWEKFHKHKLQTVINMEREITVYVKGMGRRTKALKINMQANDNFGIGVELNNLVEWWNWYTARLREAMSASLTKKDIEHIDKVLSQVLKDFKKLEDYMHVYTDMNRATFEKIVKQIHKIKALLAKLKAHSAMEKVEKLKISTQTIDAYQKLNKIVLAIKRHYRLKTRKDPLEYGTISDLHMLEL